MLSPSTTASNGREPTSMVRRASPPTASRAPMRPTPSMMPVNISTPPAGGGRRKDGNGNVELWTWIVSRVEGLRKTPQGNGMRTAQGQAQPSSFIRTMTVGSGIRPDLLTPGNGFGRHRGARGLVVTPGPDDRLSATYRRWGIAPRPEDVTCALACATAG